MFVIFQVTLGLPGQQERESQHLWSNLLQVTICRKIAHDSVTPYPVTGHMKLHMPLQSCILVQSDQTQMFVEQALLEKHKKQILSWQVAELQWSLWLMEHFGGAWVRILGLFVMTANIYVCSWIWELVWTLDLQIEISFALEVQHSPNVAVLVQALHVCKITIPYETDPQSVLPRYTCTLWHAWLSILQCCWDWSTLLGETNLARTHVTWNTTTSGA